MGHSHPRAATRAALGLHPRICTFTLYACHPLAKRAALASQAEAGGTLCAVPARALPSPAVPSPLCPFQPASRPPPTHRPFHQQNVKDYVFSTLEREEKVAEAHGDRIRYVILDLSPVTGERLL